VGEGSLSLAFAVVLYSGARYEEKGCLIMLAREQAAKV
jgi:hypothetical protein